MAKPAFVFSERITGPRQAGPFYSSAYPATLSASGMFRTLTLFSINRHVRRIRFNPLHLLPLPNKEIPHALPITTIPLLTQKHIPEVAHKTIIRRLMLDVRQPTTHLLDIPTQIQPRKLFNHTLILLLCHESTWALREQTISTPGQPISISVDTGSSDTWLPAAGSPGCGSTGCPLGTFDSFRSSSFEALNITFNDTYGVPGANSSNAGEYFYDTLQIGNATVPNMRMGLVNLTEKSASRGVFAILGIGPRPAEYVVPHKNPNPNLGAGTPMLYDQLATLGYSSRRALSLWLDNLDSQAGSILFGGIDTSKYRRSLISLPIQPLGAASLDFYSVALTSIALTDHLGTQSLTSKNFSVTAVLDTQTMNRPPAIAKEIYDRLGADTQSQTPFVLCALRKDNTSLTFRFGGLGGLNISVPFSKLIFPFKFANSTTKEGVRLCLLGIQSSPGQALLGDTFLRSAYVVYDIDNSEIVVAQASHDQGSNIIPLPSGAGLSGVSSTATFALPTASASARTDVEPSLFPPTAVAPASYAVDSGGSETSPTPSLGTSFPTSASGSAMRAQSGGVQAASWTLLSLFAGFLAAVSLFMI